MKLFLVTRERTESGVTVNEHAIVTAMDRDNAGKKAQRFLGGIWETYTISPLTAYGDKVHFALTVS